MSYKTVLMDESKTLLNVLVPWTEDRQKAMRVAQAQNLSPGVFVAVMTSNPNIPCIYKRNWGATYQGWL